MNGRALTIRLAGRENTRTLRRLAEPDAARLTTARRPDRLAVYMGYCTHRWKGHMRRGTHEGRTLSRRRRPDVRTARRPMRD
jgi:hypothetical protein